MTLNAAAVQEVFMDCLFQEGEDTSNAVIVEGITSRYGFHPQRLSNNRTSIQTLLAELPENFRESSGGGWSFLQACQTKDGQQWGEHRNAEQLMTLGLATGDAEYLLPREMWGAMPGGMPYFVVKNGA